MAGAIVLTGFGSFQGVCDNPSMEIVNQIKQELSDAGEDAPESRSDLPSCPLILRVLKVSMQAVRKSVEEIEKELQSMGLDASRDVLWIHLGVDTAQNKLRLECCATNEATFSSADESGEKPTSVAIIEDEGSIDQRRFSRLDLDYLQHELQDEFPRVCVTSSVGKFVCNYTYYWSMSRHSNALFVHIPKFEKIDKPTQVRFVKALLCKIHNAPIDRVVCPENILKSLGDVSPAIAAKSFLATRLKILKKPECATSLVRSYLDANYKLLENSAYETYEDLRKLRKGE